MEHRRLTIAAVVLGVWLMGVVSPWTEGNDGANRTSHIQSFSSRVSDQLELLYVLDTELQTVCVYAMDLRKQRLRLVAARNFRWDFRLSAYNNEGPSPEEIRRMAEEQLRGRP